MDLSLLTQITEEATKVVEALSKGRTDACISQAQDAAQNIRKAVEELERKSKRAKCSESQPPIDDMDQLLTQRNAQDQEEKPLLQEESVKSGQFVLSFGKHKGQPLNKTPPSYLCWLMGFKQKGREFVPIPPDNQTWVRNNHMETIAHGQKFLRWRCWSCYSQDVRFKHSKLCSQCWHENE